MKIRSTPIEGVTVLEPDLFADPRGVFTPMFVRDDMSAIMGDRQIIRVNHSTNRDEGTLRGFHLQLGPHEETKIVQCLRGKIYDVALDLRKGSPTFGKCYGEVLDAESRRMLVIPEGFGHAFQTMEPDTDIMYFVTGEYAPDREMNVNGVDPDLDVDWPRPVTCRSEKDTTSLTVAGHIANGFTGVELSRSWHIPSTNNRDDLDDVGRSMMRERNLLSALEKLLLHCRTITLADAGSIYLVEEKRGTRLLRFKHCQNDSVNVNYDEIAIPLNRDSMAGHVALSGEVLAIDDVYQLPSGVAYGFNNRFDKGHGYRTKSALTVPLRDEKGEIMGVLQLLNRKTAKHHKLASPYAVDQHVVPFSARDIALVDEWVANPFKA
ncbi:MAG: dTDP-4-dehydrorhamnose 3,5-epimerase family protein [Kiritimatiellia bacterium]